MSNIVHIEDDFDLEKIRLSGQCFRVKRLDDGSYRFIAGGRVLLIRELGDGNYEVSCSLDEWHGFWHGYFDFDRDYSAIREAARGKSSFVDEAMEYGRGLRILKQDPWEMLVTFIISQRKNMPAIAKSVQAVSEAFGSPIETVADAGGDVGSNANGDAGGDACSDANGDACGEILHAFPTPRQLAGATEAELRSCSLGYRAPYIAETTKQVLSGELDLEALAAFDDAELFEKLQKAHGVGAKVANCVCLFGYGRTSQVPIDVWIARAIEEECDGVDPFVQFGEDAGIMQQYVFYYMTDRNRK